MHTHSLTFWFFNQEFEGRNGCKELVITFDYQPIKARKVHQEVSIGVLCIFLPQLCGLVKCKLFSEVFNLKAIIKTHYLTQGYFKASFHIMMTG